MLNFNTNNDYAMAFSHHHHVPNDQQFYQNLYTNVSATATANVKDKHDLMFKNQKVDLLNNNSTIASEPFKDGENSKRFSVNHLLKPPASSPSEADKFNG
jgi:hypothetical protein